MNLQTPDRPAPCLSPEAEWVLVFVQPEQLDGLDYEDYERWGSVRVELRGMIEGKWIEVLAEQR